MLPRVPRLDTRCSLRFNCLVDCFVLRPGSVTNARVFHHLDRDGRDGTATPPWMAWDDQLLTVTFFDLASVVFGSLTVNTPFRYWASIASSFTEQGNTTDLENAPDR